MQTVDFHYTVHFTLSLLTLY